MLLKIALLIAPWLIFGRGLMDQSRGPQIPTQAYYSVDDGQTFFADDINLVPPFEKDGKMAVRAHVFTCDGGKTPFVAYLERYTPEAKGKIEAMKEGADPAGMEEVWMTGIEVK